MDRRRFAAGALATALLPGCHLTQSRGEADARASAAATEAAIAAGRAAAVATLEVSLAVIGAEAQGRLGTYVVDTATGDGAGFNQSLRFGMCSSFKLSLAALVLREAAAGRVRLDEQIAYSRADLLSNSPETEKHVAQGSMPIAALAEAAQIYSDNCAANLLLRRFGGPAGLTRFWREIGDVDSRLDRFETELNRVPPGEERDTTTPEAMARGVARFMAGDVLTPADRARLSGWMSRTATGARRIRAALPAKWRGGDKTGTASYQGLATRINDIAVLYPPGGRAPLVVTAYYESPDTSGTLRPEDEGVLKRVGEAVVQWAS